MNVISVNIELLFVNRTILQKGAIILARYVYQLGALPIYTMGHR